MDWNILSMPARTDVPKGLQNFFRMVYCNRFSALLGRKMEGFVCNKLEDNHGAADLSDLLIIATSADFAHLNQKTADKIESRNTNVDRRMHQARMQFISTFKHCFAF